MRDPAWTLENPTEPGFYWVVLVPLEADQARNDIRWMAQGLRLTHRVLPTFAEICVTDDPPGGLVPCFVGTEDYTFEVLDHAFGAVWWYGPIPAPPDVPGLPPLLAADQGGLYPFEVPDGWP